MTDQADIHREAFDMLCHKLIGSGCSRDVFECRIRSDLVVKVERAQEWRTFHNVMEQTFWNNNQHHEPVAKWLAPCEYLSPDGLIMLQQKVRPIDDRDVLPDRLPKFLTDIKRENFGFIGDRLVCVDYAFVIDHPQTTLKKVNWS